MEDDETSALEHPLDYQKARQLIRRIVRGDPGSVIPSKHVRERFEDRNMNMSDCLNILRGGQVDDHEEKTNRQTGRVQYGYRVWIPGMLAVVAFVPGNRLVLITCMRK